MYSQLLGNFSVFLSTISLLISVAGLAISLFLLTRPSRETGRRVRQMKKHLARKGSVTFGSSQGAWGKRSIVTVNNPTNHALFVREVRLLAREKGRDNFYTNIIMSPESNVDEHPGKTIVEPHENKKWWTQPWLDSDSLEKPEAIVIQYFIEMNNETHDNTVKTLIEKYTPKDQKLADQYWAEFQLGISREHLR
jgi:hypothetical protein